MLSVFGDAIPSCINDHVPKLHKNARYGWVLNSFHGSSIDSDTVQLPKWKLCDESLSLKSTLVKYITGSPIAGDIERYPHRPTS